MSDYAGMMLTLPQCHILTQEELFPEVSKGGLVVIVGDSPNATAKISTPDIEHRKYRQMDRLTHVSYSRKGDTWTVTGTSDYLRSEIGAAPEEAVLTFQVTPEPGCEDCSK